MSLQRQEGWMAWACACVEDVSSSLTESKAGEGVDLKEEWRERHARHAAHAFSKHEMPPEVSLLPERNEATIMQQVGETAMPCLPRCDYRSREEEFSWPG